MRKAEAEWKGNLIQGNGRLAVGSGAFDLPYSFKARFEDGQPDTNPEELIGAAHQRHRCSRKNRRSVCYHPNRARHLGADSGNR